MPFYKLMNFGILVVLASYYFSASNFAAEVGSSSYSSQPCDLTFGWTKWRPLQYIDENGEPKGFQIELVKAVAEEMNCPLKLVEGDWIQLMEAVKSGKIDFIPDATKTDKRSQFAHFSIPYRKDTFAIYVRKKDQLKYSNHDIPALRNSHFRIALNRNFLYGIEIEEWQASKVHGSSIIYSNNSHQNFDKLLAGEIDGFIEDPYVMAYKFRSEQMNEVMTTLPISITTHQSRFMFSKKKISQEFVERFNRALEKVKKRAEFQMSWFKLEEF